MFEPPQRNSGILGGKFLERGRIKKPDGVNYFFAPVSKVFYFLCSLLFILVSEKRNKDFLRLVLGVSGFLQEGVLIGPWNPKPRQYNAQLQFASTLV